MNDGCELAITRTGWGPCHHFLVILCGLCTLAEATASLIVLIVSPLLACDLKFDKHYVILLNAISSLGMAFGGFLFGVLADTNGRKRSIPMTMVVIFCASVVLSFAHRLAPISIAVFLLGIGVAGNNVALRVYLVECLPAKRRGACLAMLDLLWVVGYLATLGISWSLVPSVVRMLGNEFRPSSWRVLAGLGGAPSLIMACVASLLPSSPRYLLYRRHPERALAVLQQMYAVNNSRHVDHYPDFIFVIKLQEIVTSFQPSELEGCVRPDDNGDIETDGFFNTIQQHLMKIRRRIKTIYSSPYTRTTVLASLSRIFLFPGLMWFAAWMAHVSLKGDKYQANDLTIDKTYNSSDFPVDAGDIAASILYNCHEADSAYFEYFLLLSTSYILGEVFLVIGIDVVGRRLSIVTSGLVGGTAIVALLFVTRRAARILFSMLFLASYSIINTTTSVVLLENYPTSVRGTVVGLTSVLPHLAAFFVKFFARVYREQSIYVATGLIIGAALAAIPLPDLARAPMQE